MSFDRVYLKRVLAYVLATVLALGLALYIIYHLWQTGDREIVTAPALLQNFSVTAEYEAWIFRDETPIAATAQGRCIPSARDGERVAKGAAVAALYNVTDEAAVSSLESVRNRIRLLESEHIASMGSDLGIGEAMLDLRQSTKNGSLRDAAAYSDTLSALILARAEGEGSTAELLESLRLKEASLLSSIGTSTGGVYAPKSGWYYKTCDGYESLFTADAVKDITPAALDSLIAAAPADPSPAGRLVLSHTWYAAVDMTLSDGSFFSEGDTLEVEVPGFGEPVELTVASAVRGSDSVAVVFSCSVIPEGVDIGRRVTLRLELESISGYGIPKEALRSLDGFTGVYTFNGVVANFKRADIAAELGDIYVVTVPSPEADAPVTVTTEADTTGTEGTGTDMPQETAPPSLMPEDIYGEGTGRKDYYYLSTFDQIIVEGKNLYHGKIIG